MHAAIVDRGVVENVELNWSRLESLELYLNQQRVPFRIGNVALGDTIAACLRSVDLTKAEDLGVRNFDLMGCVFRLALSPSLAVGDDKLQQSRICLIDGRIIDLVQRTFTSQREPDV